MIVKDLMDDLEKGDRTKEMIAKKEPSASQNIGSFLNNPLETFNTMMLNQQRNQFTQQAAQAPAFWR